LLLVDPSESATTTHLLAKAGSAIGSLLFLSTIYCLIPEPLIDSSLEVTSLHNWLLFTFPMPSSASQEALISKMLITAEPIEAVFGDVISGSG